MQLLSVLCSEKRAYYLFAMYKALVGHSENFHGESFVIKEYRESS